MPRNAIHPNDHRNHKEGGEQKQQTFDALIDQIRQLAYKYIEDKDFISAQLAFRKLRRVVVMDVVVRTEGSPESIVPTLRRKVRELDPELPLANVRTMQEWISNSAAQPQLNARLLTLFAAMALLIAAIGIYAVLAYSVTQRTREIGLRIALGAHPSDVVRLIVSEGMRVALVGICAGLVGALIPSRRPDLDRKEKRRKHRRDHVAV